MTNPVRRRRAGAATVADVPEVSPAGDAPKSADTQPETPKSAVTRRQPAGKTKGPEAPPEELAPLAKEINVRLDKAAKLDSQAEDHRIAAAKQLAAAKEICVRAGISFEKWAETNIQEVNGKQVGFQVIRKLANLGEAEDPAAKLAADRAAQAERAKASRDRKKTADAAPASAPSDDGPFTPQPENGPSSPPTAPAVLTLEAARELTKAWPEADKMTLVLDLFQTIIDGERKLLDDMVDMMTANDRLEFFTALADKQNAVISYPDPDPGQE